MDDLKLEGDEVTEDADGVKEEESSEGDVSPDDAGEGNAEAV